MWNRILEDFFSPPHHRQTGFHLFWRIIDVLISTNDENRRAFKSTFLSNSEFCVLFHTSFMFFFGRAQE